MNWRNRSINRVYVHSHWKTCMWEICIWSMSLHGLLRLSGKPFLPNSTKQNKKQKCWLHLLLNTVLLLKSLPACAPLPKKNDSCPISNLRGLPEMESWLSLFIPVHVLREDVFPSLRVRQERSSRPWHPAPNCLRTLARWSRRLSHILPKVLCSCRKPHTHISKTTNSCGFWNPHFICSLNHVNPVVAC